MGSAERHLDDSRPPEEGPDATESLPPKLLFEISGRAGDTEGAVFTLEVKAPAEDGVSYVPAEEIWGLEGGLGTRLRIDTTMVVGTAGAVWAPLRRLLELDVPSGIEIDQDEVGELLDGAATRLSESGFEVQWLDGLENCLGSTVVIGASGVIQRSVADVFDGSDPLAFSWRISIDGDPLTDEERLAVAWAGAPVIDLRGRRVLVAPSVSRKARIPDLKALTAIDALSIALTGSTRVGDERVDVVVEGWLKNLRDELASPVPFEAGPDFDPVGLEGELREYQREGVAWLDRMTGLGLGGCLADDMGLGKTVMLIALHLRRLEKGASRGRTLVVCPTSIIPNWEREIERFAPGEKVVRYHGPDRVLDDDQTGFVITSYQTMRKDADVLSAETWGLIAADEAQHVKNHRSASAKALRALPARGRVALTGTPIENELSELWSILDWTTPGLLGGITEFKNRWVESVEAGRDPEQTARLARLVRPFVLRRRKIDPGIAPELPAKTVTDHLVSPTTEQAALYRKHMAESMAEIRNAEGMGRRGLVLNLLTSLKQICNHPAHFLGEKDGSLDGRSGKLELFDDLTETLVGEGGRALVFTQYVEMGRLLSRRLQENGIESRFLHGGTQLSTRQKMVDAFQAEQFPVFVLSLKAGGTGLNLTAADHVIHYDRWWNPATEDQATDRAHRIGQDKAVQVHRLTTEGTLEERIADLHETKRALAEAIVGGGEAALTELANEDLQELLELRFPG